MANARAARGSPSRITTLRKRAEFLRVRKGLRCATPSFVVEAKERPEIAPDQPAEAAPRFGFTVTRQVGHAVERNRIRRRLKAAVKDAGLKLAKSGFDYVVIARRPALTSPFATLADDLAKAIARMHKAPRGAERAR
jgi:ribonuclease P protein component